METASQSSSKNMKALYELNKCVEWIKSNAFKTVCLQFPDSMLSDSTEVVELLESELNQKLYILGDTAYGSCCIDYVAAAHVTADAIIHFGDICFSKPTDNIPVLNIYEKWPLDVKSFAECCCSFVEKMTLGEVNLILDTGYIHLKEQLRTAFSHSQNIQLKTIQEINSLGSDDKDVIFLGQEKKLVNLNFLLKGKPLYYYSPSENTIESFEQNQRILKRRMFLSEKIKESAVIGIIIATLAVKNYIKVIERLKKLLKLNDKKYYIISVGKPNVAKLANFAEIDIYVIIACSMYELYESRDFFKPIATPYDVEIALNPHPNVTEFSYDFNSYLPEANVDIPDPVNEEQSDQQARTNMEIVERDKGVVALNSTSGLGYLHSRSWQGLELKLGQSEVKMAEEGRKGIARGYENEVVE